MNGLTRGIGDGEIGLRVLTHRGSWTGCDVERCGRWRLEAGRNLLNQISSVQGRENC